MIIAVTGWRYHEDQTFIWREMDDLLCRYESFFAGEIGVRGGDATGADALVEQWCLRNGITYDK